MYVPKLVPLPDPIRNIPGWPASVCASKLFVPTVFQIPESGPIISLKIKPLARDTPVVRLLPSIVTVDPVPVVTMPPDPDTVSTFAAGIAVPDPVRYDVATTAAAVTVTAAPDPLVSIPVPPEIVRALAAGVAVPESVGKLMGTVAVESIVIDPAPFVTVIPVPAVIVDKTGSADVLAITS